MKEHVSVIKSLKSGTVVTVTLKEDGLMARADYVSSPLKVTESVGFARKEALRLLEQAKQA